MLLNFQNNVKASSSKNEFFRLFLVFFLFLTLIKSQCPESCLICSNNNTICTTCVSQNNLILVNSSLGCLPCPSKCLKCTSQNSTMQCITCSTGYYADPTTLICLKCEQSNCKRCSVYFPKQCQQCETLYFLQQASSTCKYCPSQYLNAKTCRQNYILSCDEGYFTSSGQTCSKCSQNFTCRACSSSTICSQCFQGHYLSIFRCLKCDSSCRTCSSNNTCSSCNKGFRLNTLSRCQTCGTPNCASCTILDVCRQCKEEYYFDFQNKTCPALDPKKTVKNCTIYGNNFNFTITGLFATNSILCRTCVTGMYLNLQTNTCQTCSLLCDTCSGMYRSSKCTSCNNYYGRLIDLTNEICSPKIFTSNNQKVAYFNNRNNIDSYARSGKKISFTQSLLKCPGGILSSQVSLKLSSMIGYKYSFHVKILQTASLLSYSIIISLNDIQISQKLIPDPNDLGPSFTSQKCNDLRIFQFSFEFSLIQFAQNLSILNSQTANYLTFKSSLADQVLIDVRELIILYTQCHQTCALCYTYQKCTKCETKGHFLQQQMCLSKCANGYFRNNVDTSCVLQCPKGMYSYIKAMQWTCQICNPSCSLCNEINICTKCNDGYFLHGNQCLSQCPLKYFKNLIHKKCEKCITPCQQCISARQCTKCAIGFRFQGNNTCLHQCPDQLYGNLKTMTCEACQSPCYTCKTISKCLSCTKESNLTYFEEKCLVHCNSQYYAHRNQLQQLSCQFCEFPCFQCVQNPTKCTKCITGFLLSSKNTCISTCPVNYFSSITYMQCLRCQAPCLNCKHSQKICTSCINGYFYNQQQKSCLLKCSDGFFPNITSNQCKNCPQQCQLCVSQQKCTLCNDDFYLQNVSCLSKCSDGYFKSLVNNQNICSKCSTNCKRCFGQNDFCLECFQYFFLQRNNTCSSSCQITELFPGCEPCQHPCYSCQFSKQNCTSCANNYFYFWQNNQCVSECYIGYYKIYEKGFGICELCTFPCINCLNEKYCFTCSFVNQTKYYLQTLSATRKICVTNCSSYEYKKEEQAICMFCKSPCLTCVNETFCKSCQNGILTNGNCVSKVDGCPIGNYQITQNQIIQTGINITIETCAKCPAKCSSCRSQTVCTGCSANFYLFEISCLDFCPSGTAPIKQLRSCIYCQYPCVECWGISSNCTQCGQLFLSSPSVVCPQSRKYGNLCIKYYLYNGQCTPQCSSISYPQLDKCLSCISPCLTCTSSQFCTSCIQNTYMLESICYDDCPVEYYEEKQTNQCQKCQYACQICQSLQVCLQCRQGYLFENKCLINENCPTGYFDTYEQMLGKYCQKCEEKCVACSQSKQKCIECSKLSILRGKCYQICPDGYYSQFKYSQYLDNKQILYCQKCQDECLTCKDQQKCLNCVFSYYLLDNKCVNRCPPTYMQRISTYEFNEQVNYTVSSCSQCIPPCQSCFLEENLCQSCMAGYFMYDKKCMQSCPQGTYLNQLTRSCKQCMFPCILCQQKKGDIICQKCVGGYYINKGLCVQKCHNKFIDFDFKRCADDCSTGYEVQNIRTKIKFCAKDCYLPYLKDFKNKKCVASCQQKEYINAKYQCVQTYGDILKPQVKNHLFINIKGLLTLYMELTRPVTFTDTQSLQKTMNISLKSYSSSMTPFRHQSRFLVQALTKKTEIPFVIARQSQSHIIVLLFPRRSIFPPSSVQIQFNRNSNLYFIDKISKIPLQKSTFIIQIQENQSFEAYDYKLLEYNRFGFIGEIIVDFILMLGLMMLVFNRYAKIYNLLIFMQTVFMLVCLDVNMPPNLYRFLQGFKYAHFYQFGNLLVKSSETQRYADLSNQGFNRIQSIFSDVNFLKISGHLVCLYIAILILRIILELIKYLPKFSNQVVSQIMTKINEKTLHFKWSHITDIFISTFMLILASFFFQTIDYSSHKTQQPIGIALSYIFVLILLTYAVYFSYKNYKITKLAQNQPQKFVQKQYLYREDYIPFFEGISTHQSCYKNYLLVMKILIYGVLTGLLWDYPNFCLSVWIVFEVIYGMIYLLKKPFSDAVQNYFNAISCLVFAVSMVLIIIVNEDGSSVRKRGNSSFEVTYEIQRQIQDTKQLLGYFVIVLILICVFILMVDMLISIMQGNLKRKKLQGEDEQYKEVKPNSPSALAGLQSNGPTKIAFQQKREFTGYSVNNLDSYALTYKFKKNE